jgi:hypothetical protein
MSTGYPEYDNAPAGQSRGLNAGSVTLASLDAKLDFIKALVDDLQQQVTRQHRHQPHTMRRQGCPDCEREASERRGT